MFLRVLNPNLNFFQITTMGQHCQNCNYRQNLEKLNFRTLVIVNIAFRNFHWLSLGFQRSLKSYLYRR